MRIEVLPQALTVCKVGDIAQIDLSRPLFFIGKTDRELSLVCETRDTPARTLEREDGWRGFRVAGTLDFSLVGILSRLSGILAAEGIGIFAVSTYDTDYILVKRDNLDRALRALAVAGYEVDDALQ